MSCIIQYNKDGKISRVNTPEGKESMLFNQLAKIPHMDTLEQALESFKNVYAKKMNVFYHIIGKKGAQQLDTTEESKFREDALVIAKQMEEQGKSVSEIRLATGWEKNQADGKWRYEIMDGTFNDMELSFTEQNINFENPVSVIDLDGLYNNENLYKAYPQIKNTKIVVYDTINPLFDENKMFVVGNTIYLNKKVYVKENRLSINPSSREGGDLLHEIQHVIQNIEGFGRGSSPAWNREQIEESLNFIRGGSKEINSRPEWKREYDRYIEQIIREKLAENIADNVLTTEALSSEFVASSIAMDIYKRFSGEVEARNVQNRAGLTEDERQQITLEDTQDLPYESQLYLQFISDQGNSFQSFKEALSDSIGGDIEVGINTQDGFRPLHVISSNTNKNTKGGLINYLIKNGILSDTKIIEDGASYLKAEGYDQAKQVVNEILSKESFVNAKVHKDGRIELIRQAERKISEQNEKIYAAVKEAQARVFGAKQPTLTEDALKDRLLDFLKGIGVTVTTIEEYNKKFGQKNGTDPSAEALADIANQIVAFREGNMDIALLSEEAAHFIVEGWNEAEIENLLRSIHKTDSYQQHAATYREIYSRENPNMSEEEVEKLVRKEVLGKELANALVTRFSQEGKTEAQVSILNRIYDLLLQFFDKITLQGNYKQQLDDLTGKVEDLLIHKDVNRYINSDNYNNRKFRMYSVSQAANPQKALIKVLQEQERILKQLGRGSSEQVKQLEDLLMREMDKSTVREMTTLAKRQTRYIKDAITEANRRGTTLSNEENIVYQNLKNMISPALASLKVTVDRNPEYAAEVADIKTVQQDIADTVGLVKNSENDILEQLVDKLVKRHKLDFKVDANGNIVEDTEAREYLMEAIKTAKKDTNAMYSYFGQITQANDPMLNMLGVVIGDMYQDSNEEFSERAKEFQRTMRELGFKEKDIAQFLQEDGYITSKWNFTEFEAFRNHAQAKVYSDNLDRIIADLNARKAKGDTTVAKELAEHEANKAKSTDQLVADFKSMPWISNGELRQEVVTDSQKLINTGSEPFLSEAYLKEQEDRLERLGISQMTRTKLKGFSNARAMVKKGMRRSKNGVPILTLQNKHDLDFINIERRTAASIYDITGKLKDGITVHNSEVPNSVQISENEYITLGANASNEAIIAFEMNKLTRDFINEKNKGGAVASENLDKTTHALWWKDLADMEADPEVTREDIISWFNLNTSVGFSKTFFEENENVDLFAEFENDDNVKDKIKDYKEALRSRRAIINQFRDPNNAVNTLAEDIPESVKNDVLAKSEDIDRMSSEIFIYIKGKNKNKAADLEETVVRATTGANEAYFGAINDNNVTSNKQKLDFSLKHMTASNRKRVQEFADAVKLGLNTDKFSGYPASEEGILQYAQTKLLPYYSSYAPLGLQNFYNDIRNTNENVSELVEKLNADPNVRISVSYDYLDTSNTDILNKDRDPDFKGGYAQPSLTKKPTVFGRTFDFNNKEWSKIAGNQKLKELYDKYIEFQVQSLIDNDSAESNVYISPQVPKTGVERVKSLITKESGETISEWWKGLANYRVGDIAEGETDEAGASLYSAGIRVIPRYFMHKLEDQSNVSKDLFYSSMMMAQQASLRKNRVKYYAQMSSVMDAIHSDGRYSDIGKQAESTNTYKMAKSYLDNAFYGVEDTARFRVSLPILGQRDLTKLVKRLHRYKQNLSLALNPIVPMTSYLTAASGLFGERIIGQYVDSDSMNKAHRAFNKNIMGGVSEGLEAYSNNTTTSMLEHFGLLDVSNRYANSAYSKMERFFGKSMYGLHQMADYPIKSNVLYSNMFGHRIYKEKLLDFNEFKKIGTGQGKSKAEINTEWKELKSLYDYAQVENGKFSYKDNLYTDLKVSKEEFRNLEKGVISKGKSLASRVDGTMRDEERTFAQRHFALRYTQTHKGWLAIAVASRFKGQHLNLMTGEMEEGSYSSTTKFIGRGIDNLYGGIRKKDFSDFVNMWKNASDVEKRNMQRICYEMAILGSITALGVLFSGFSDDDEEDFSKQYLAYLFERGTNETISSQAGIVKELYSSVKEPVVGLSQLLEIPKAYKVLTGSDEVVERGRYAGLTEQERWLIKNVVGLKPAYDLSSAKNLKSQRDSYNFFNHGNEDWNPFSLILSKGDEEDE